MDKLIKSLIYGGQVSLTVIKATEMVNRCIEIHKCAPAPAAALGRAMICTTFMCSFLKSEEDRLSVTIRGDGLSRETVVAGNSALEMRGYIDNPQANPPLKRSGKLDVSAVIGKRGKISVVKSMGLKEPYTGSANLISGELAEDFAAYYLYSEQQPTAMALGVGIEKDLSCFGAGGVIMQPLPGCDEKIIDELEKKASEFSSVSSIMREAEAEEVTEKFFDAEILETLYPKYRCLCSEESMKRMLLTLGKEECEDIIRERGKIEIVCQFCERKYIFTQKEVDGLFIK